MPPLFSDSNRKLFRVIDGFVLLVSFLAAAKVFPYIRPLFAPSGLLYNSFLQDLSPNPTFQDFEGLRGSFWVLLLVLPTTIFVMELLRGYEGFARQSRARLVINSVLAPVSGLAVVTVAFYAARFPGYSRVFLFTFIFSSVLGITSYRIFVHMIITRRFVGGVYARETALVGPAHAVSLLASFFTQRVPRNERHLVGFFGIPEEEHLVTADTSPPELPRLGGVESIGDALIHRPIQDVVIIVPYLGAEWLNRVLASCDYFRISAHVVPEQLLFPDLTDLQVLPTHLCTLPAVTFAPVEENEDDAGVYFWKRLIDVAVSGTALIALAPLFALIAIAIKLTTPSLTVFYALDVVGFRGRRFKEYKFTTMVANAELQKKDLMALNEMSGPVFKIAHDPRVTPLGRFLRKYSLNELPQLWNVLVGDMSLVGPRPAGPHELERYEMWHKRKLSVRPGITCFWQVRGRNAISNFDDWVRMDLEYIRTRCTRLDLQILVRTAWVVVRGTGS